MKILCYEFRKLFTQSHFISLCIGFIAINLLFSFLQISQNQQSAIQNHTIYETIKTKYPIEQIDDLQERIAFYDQVIEIEKILLSEEEQVVTYDDSFMQAYQSYIESEEYDDFQIYNQVSRDVYSYYDSILNYETLRQDIVDKSMQYQHGFLSSTLSNEKLQTLQMEQQLYTHLANTHPYEVNYISIELFMNDISSALIFVFITIFLCLNVFYVDEHSEAHHLIHITKKGGAPTLAAKMICVISISCVLQIICSLSTLYMYQAMYGMVDVFAPIQSIPSLHTAPYTLSIFQAIALSIAIRCIAMITTSIFFIGLVKLCKSKAIALTIFVCIAMIQILLYLNIQPLDSLNIFKYINMFTLFMATPYIGIYKGFTIFTYLPIWWILSIFIGCILVLSLFVSFYFSSKTYALKKCNLRVSFAFLYKHTCLLFHEILRTWISKRLLLIVSILFCIQVYFVSSSQLSPTTHAYEQQISEVYDLYGGKMNEEKIQTLQQTHTLYTQSNDDFETLQNQYARKEISYEEYLKGFDEYHQDAAQRALFQQVYTKYNGQEYFVYPKGYQAIFSINTNTREMRSALFLMICMILLFFGVYSSDYKDHQNHLYILTTKGTTKRLIKNIQIVCISAILITFLYSGLELLFFKANYPMHTFDAPFASILPMDSNIQLSAPLSNNMPIYAYYICLLLVRLFGVISLGICTLFISHINKKSIYALLLCILLFLFPFLLFNFNVQEISYVSIFDLIMGNQFLLHSFSIVKIGVLLGIDIALLIYLFKKNKQYI